MKSIYLAIIDKCNYKCKYCPCNSKKIKTNAIPVSKIIKYIEAIKDDDEKNRIVLSGGEPTIHPEFFELLKYFQDKGYYVTLLTNGSMITKENFINKIKENFDIKKLNIVMTIFDIDEKKHDEGTQIKGSYQNTLLAFKLLIENNINVTLKHCISRQNYRRLPKFYKYFDKMLPNRVAFQLTTLDFWGMNNEQIKKNAFSFRSVKKYLNKTLKNINKSRKLIVVNTPLCSADEKYWKYFVKKQTNPYKGYKTTSTQAQNVGYNCDCYSSLCKECKANNICPGIYQKNYEIKGDRIIKPIKKRDEKYGI